MALLPLLIPATPSSAESCDHPYGGVIEIATGGWVLTFYVDDVYSTSDGMALVYEESNGIWSERGAGAFQDKVAEDNSQRSQVCPIVPPCSAECEDPSDYL